MKKTCCLIYNPTSSRIRKVNIKEIKNRLYDSGYEVEELRSEYPGHVVELVKYANKSDLTITMGGDGTVGEAIRAYNEIKKQKSIYSHIPTGTTNDIATNLGLSKKNPLISVDRIIGGKDYNIDVVTANNHPFAYISCFGYITNISYDTSNESKKKLGRLAYIMRAFTNDLLKKPEKYKITYTIDGINRQTDCMLCFVTNSKGVGGIKIYNDADINDGLFEVLIIKKSSVRLMMQLVGDYLTNTFDFKKYSKEIVVYRTDNFKVSFDDKIPSNAINSDGEKALFTITKENNTIEYKMGTQVKMRLPIKP